MSGNGSFFLLGAAVFLGAFVSGFVFSAVAGVPSPAVHEKEHPSIRLALAKSPLGARYRRVR
jgi:hypothetical protein